MLAEHVIFNTSHIYWSPRVPRASQLQEAHRLKTLLGCLNMGELIFLHLQDPEDFIFSQTFFLFARKIYMVIC